MLTILVGLPGSGKGTMAREKARAFPRARVYENLLGGWTALQPKRGLFNLLRDVRASRVVFADDPFLIRPDERTIFADLLAPFIPAGYPVRWVYFANSPEICLRNVEHRSRLEPSNVGRNEAALKWVINLPPYYVIPEGVEPVPVVDHSA